MAISKIKVSEFAKDLKSTGKELLDILEPFKTKVKNVQSAMDTRDMDIILDFLTIKYAVAEFVFLQEKEQEAKEPKKKKEPDMTEEEFLKVLAELEEEKEKEKEQQVVVSTRHENVDLTKYDDEEKISGLVDNDIYEENLETKQKLVKKGQRQQEKRTSFKEEVRKEKPKIEHLDIDIPPEISVGEFAKLLKRPAADVVKSLMKLGIMASISQIIDFDTAELIGTDFNATIRPEIIVTDEDILFAQDEDNPKDLKERSPVVVVMGHVDHGKTSLLDTIRNANVMEGEAGGITQHIGAYRVRVGDRKITFLDTPGHEAFTSMRARGAQTTDIAILVVAADDGIMPQTIESISHAKAAGVHLIVAINKIDKEGANIEKVKQELTEHEIVPEEWGGDTICVPISAKQGTNIDQLLEMVLLVADMKELKANPKKTATGTVIEARLDKAKGPVATVLVQNGTLKMGDIIIAGTATGRIRAMMDDKGKAIKAAGPSVPVEVLGFAETPEGGDLFHVVQDERLARDVAEQRKHKNKVETHKATKQAVTLDSLFDRIKEGELKDLNIIVKADVQGSVEAVCQSLGKLSNEEVRVRIIHSGVGTVNDSDVMLASTSGAIIIGFNVRPTAQVTDAAERAGVDMRLYRIIYQAIEEVEAALKGMLAPVYKESVLGHAEVREIFKASGIGTIAGCYVTDGKILRGCECRLVRDGIVIHEGQLSSLKRFKDDAKEVATGYECGMTIENFNDIKEGDMIESFEMVEVER